MSLSPLRLASKNVDKLFQSFINYNEAFNETKLSHPKWSV